MTYEELLEWVDAHPWIDPETEIYNWWALPGWVQRDILDVTEEYRKALEGVEDEIEDDYLEDIEELERLIAETEEDIDFSESEIEDLEAGEETGEEGEET